MNGLFQIALQKAGLEADQVWYCGDSVKADVYGAHGAGLFPVLYEGETDEHNPYAVKNDRSGIDFEYLHLHDWRELIKIIDRARQDE